MKFTSKNKRGIALLWALIISLVMMIITGTMVTIITKESQSSLRIEESAQAYAAAKTGLDWGIWYVNNKGTNPILSTVTRTINIDAGSNANVVIEPVVTGIVINSTGNVGPVRRMLSYQIIPTVMNIIPADSSSFTPTSGGFVAQFDVWTSATGYPFSFGLSNAAGQYLAISIDGSGNATLISSATSPSGPISETLLPDIDDPYRYRVTIKYVDDTSATLEIRQKETTGYRLLGSQSIALIGANFNPFDRFYKSTPNAFVNNDQMFFGNAGYILLNDHGYVSNIRIIN